MKILWLSPWLRPLARVQIEAITRLGVEAMLITSDRHPEPSLPISNEILIEPSMRNRESWPALRYALSKARSFRPDLVVAELVWDPRWLVFSTLAPVVQIIHDDRPHDESEQRPFRQQLVGNAWRFRADRIVVHSKYVQHALGPHGHVPCDVVPLTSDLDPSGLSVPLDNQPKRDFVVVGRIRPYKNLKVTLEAWHRYMKDSRYVGDRLIILGAGEEFELPDQVVWMNRNYRYSEVVPIITNAKASIVNYQKASQSGVQLMSMQLGAAVIISEVGGLPEFQAPGHPIVPPDDINALLEQFVLLSSQREARTRGREALQHYIKNFSAEKCAGSWIEVFRSMTS